MCVTGITNPAIYRREHNAATTCPFRITNPAIYRREHNAATTCPLFSSLGHPKLKPKQIGEIFLLVPGVNRSGYGFVRPVDLDLNGENGFSDFNGFFRAQR